MEVWGGPRGVRHSPGPAREGGGPSSEVRVWLSLWLWLKMCIVHCADREDVHCADREDVHCADRADVHCAVREDLVASHHWQLINWRLINWQLTNGQLIN